MHPYLSCVYEMGKSGEHHIYFSDLWHSQLLAANQKATCCQLCVVTCAWAACEQKEFILLQLPHPRKVFFRQRGSSSSNSYNGEPRQLSTKTLIILQRKSSNFLNCMFCLLRFHSFFSKLILYTDLWVVSFKQVKPGCLLQVTPLMFQCCYLLDLAE